MTNPAIPRLAEDREITLEEIRDNFSLFADLRAVNYVLWMVAKIEKLQADIRALKFALRVSDTIGERLTEHKAETMAVYADLRRQLDELEDKIGDGGQGEFIPEIPWVKIKRSPKAETNIAG